MKSQTRTLLIGGTIIASYLILGGSALAASAATAATKTGSRQSMHAMSSNERQVKPMVVGTVSGINGAVITVASKNGTTYAVDTSNAKISSGFGSSAHILSSSAIALNDTVAVIGTRDGTSIKATAIMDGVSAAHGMNGSPHFGGIITALNGSSFTISSMTRGQKGATNGTVTYTVTTTSSTVFMKNNTLDSLSDLAVGQRVMITGTLDTASNVISAAGVNLMTMKKASRS